MAIENPDLQQALGLVDFVGGAPVFTKQQGFNAAIVRTPGEPVGVFELTGDLAGFGSNTLASATPVTPIGVVGAKQYGATAKVIIGVVNVVQVVVTEDPGGAGVVAKSDTPFVVSVKRLDI